MGNTFVFYLGGGIFLIPWKELQKQYPTVSTLPSFHFICDWRTKMGLQKHTTISAFLKVSKTFTVWMGGWAGGDQKCPSIFLIFKNNINKKNMLISNMVLKIVYGFFNRSYNVIILSFKIWQAN